MNKKTELSPEVKALQQEWLVQAAAVRERSVGAGIALRHKVDHMSGLELLTAMLDGKLPYPHICDTLGFILVEAAMGRVVFQGTPVVDHYNPMGTVHGGWYATLLDSAVACAVHSTLPVGRAYTTAELGLNIVRAATEHTGPLRAIGEVIHVGRQMSTAQGRIVDVEGRIYAHCTTTCFMFDAKPAQG
jgi:uncharacterized protein (TIGR00369 family)